MGLQPLLLMFAAITLGGLGSAFGALVGGVIVGVFIELLTWVLPGVRAEERRRPAGADRRPADPAAGHPGPQKERVG